MYRIGGGGRVGLTCIHGTRGDVVNADTTGLEFLGDTAGSVSHLSLLLQECRI